MRSSSRTSSVIKGPPHVANQYQTGPSGAAWPAAVTVAAAIMSNTTTVFANGVSILVAESYPPNGWHQPRHARSIAPSGSRRDRRAEIRQRHRDGRHRRAAHRFHVSRSTQRYPAPDLG